MRMSLPLTKFEYSHSREDALHRAATEWGIEREFWDIFGHHHVASGEIEARILGSLGLDVSSLEAVDRARRERFEKHASSLVPGTSVISESQKSFELVLFAGPLPKVMVELTLETGSVSTYNPDPLHIEPVYDLELGHQRWTAYRVPLPAETPLGYHRIRISIDDTWLAEGRVIVCPDRAYLPDHLREAARAAG